MQCQQGEDDCYSYKCQEKIKFFKFFQKSLVKILYNKFELFIVIDFEFEFPYMIYN